MKNITRVEPKIAPQVAVCATCGSPDVRADAFAKWSITKQAFELSDTYDKGSVCEACGGECRIVMRDATPDELHDAGVQS